MSLKTNIESGFTRVATEIKAVRTQFAGNASGSLAGLTTSAKASLVAAINELDAAIEALASAEGGATIADGVPSTTSVWSSSKTNSEIASKVATALASVIDAAPGALDTLNELAAALGDDANFASTITGQLALKAPLASPAFTGTPTAPTATAGTSTTQVATTAFVAAAVAAVTIPDASATVKGKVELATDAEAIAGADTVRAVTPANLMAVVGDSTASFVTTFEAGLA